MMKYRKGLLPVFLAVTVMCMAGLTGCGAKEDTVQKTETKEETEAEAEEQNGMDAFVQAQAEAAKAQEDETEESEASDTAEVDPEKLLRQYYDQVIVQKEGLMELPSGYEVLNKEKHLENYTIGEAFFQETGVCYQAVWDYDKDEQDELLVLVLDKDEDYERSKLYARMYEVVDGEVVQAAELESLFGWMEYDIRQSTEVLLRETKDWFYLAEQARGASGIYADGVCYAIRVAHYDGNDFVVDVAKQMQGSDFSETDEEVADTARLLNNVGFANTAKHLTYEYSFDRKDDLLSVFYMTAEHDGSLDTYYNTGNIADVPPFLVRLFAEREE